MNYRVGSIVRAEADLNTGSPALVHKGSLGVVLSFERNSRTDAVENFVVDFGMRAGTAASITVTDLTWVSLYSARLRKRKQAKT